MTSPLYFLPATELARLIRTKAISAVEVISTHLEHIEQVNPQVNAIVTLVAEQALAAAHQADSVLAQGRTLGPLHGLPVAHKDLQPTAGIRTTFGSPIYRNNIPTTDSLVVERIKQAGAITLGKTNTPEFGAGSQTFNPVFGATLNPYDRTKTCGGSSGGAAVALASGFVALADGSDMGGSLRNPANFCNVVGLRPSPGRVPSWPSELGWYTLSVDGPMARTVADVALLLSALASPDSRSPIALSDPGSLFAQPLDRDFKGVRIAWLGDLGLPFEPEVLSAVAAQRAIFESLGCIVEDASPDFTDADEIFKTLRAWNFANGLYDEYLHHRDQLKDTVIWNIEAGLKLSGQQVSAAETKRTALYQRLRTFMQTYEYLVLPVSQVLPFPVTQPYVTAINGTHLETYIDWMKSCYYISVTGHPALSVPCAFSSTGLPIGLQIVGRHQADWSVLQLGQAFEQATQLWQRHPTFEN